MESFISFEIGIYMALYGVLLSIFKLVLDGIKNQKIKKNSIKEDEVEGAKQWVETHCTLCGAELKKEHNVCSKCGKLTSYGAIRYAVKLKLLKKKLSKWAYRILTVIILVVVILIVSGQIPVLDIFDSDDSLMAAFLELLKQSTIGMICFWGLLICGIYFIVLDWIYDRPEERCESYFDEALSFYVKKVKTEQYTAPEITNTIKNKNSKERKKLCPENKELIKTSIVRAVVVLVALAGSFTLFMWLMMR